MIIRIHRGVVALIRRLPERQAVFCFRAYNKLLKTMAAEYRARTFFGARLYCDPRDLIQRMILHFGVWEPEVTRVIEASLSPGDVFVDIGANIGYDALLASTLVGKAGAIVAIEASPSTFALLERNLALNSAANVRAVHAAVSDRRGMLELYEPFVGNIGAATTLASRGGRHVASVEALPLEEILTPSEIARVRLMKLDIEGAEPPIMMRVVERLALFPRNMEIIVEASPTDDPEAWRDVFRSFRAAGFRVYAIENSYELEWYLAQRSSAALAQRSSAALAQRSSAALAQRSAASLREMTEAPSGRPQPTAALLELTEAPTKQQDLLFTRNTHGKGKSAMPSLTA